MPFQLVRNDITKVTADVIVNTANPKPTFGSGTDKAVYMAAGKDELLAERVKIGDIARGDIAVTPAFKLDAKYIIHTVGPVWVDGNKGEFDILKSCYMNSLKKCAELGCKSIAFPLIATGVYGFPKDKALNIAVSTITEFLMEDDSDIMVYIVVFDKKAVRLSQIVFNDIQAFIGDDDVLEAHKEEYGISDDDFYLRQKNSRLELEREQIKLEQGENSYLLDVNWGYESSIKSPNYKKPFNADTFDKSEYESSKKDEAPFVNNLIKYLNKKDLSNKEVYAGANVSRGAFSKIMCGDTLIPKKDAVLGLCIGLKLDKEEASDLLASAGYGFNPYDKRDLLVMKCINHCQYDIGEINAMLWLCDQPTLGKYDED